MSRNTFIRMVVLSCVALSAACSGESDTVDNTELNVLIPRGSSQTGPGANQFDIQVVEYTIACNDGIDYDPTENTEIDSGPTLDNDVTINGVLEVLDEGDQLPGVNTQDFGPDLGEVHVFQGYMNLPTTAGCTVQLRASDRDGEVICTSTETFEVLADNKTTVNVLIVCGISYQDPVGTLDLDGIYELIHGNYCPQLFWLGAVPTFADPTVMDVHTSYIDPDNGCGQNCDPTTCDFSVIPPVCNPAPDPGLSSMLIAPADNGGFGNMYSVDTTYSCDPLLPGPTEICVLVSDGDNDCDQMRCITIDCPDLCEGVVCDDVDQNGNPNECTRDLCNPLDGSCSNDPAPDGIACNSCGSTCQSGACTGAPFTADIEFNGTATLSGTQQVYNATLVNPYSGASVPVSGTFRVNDLSYKGTGTADILSGIMPGGTQSEVLLIQDLIHAQTVCGVETLSVLNGFDVMFLADDFIVLQNMVIEGGTNGDLLWANAGDDTVRGNMGDDLIDGGPGDDMIEGGRGDDTITLWPGSGFDSVSGDLSSGNLSITDRVEIDAIQSQILITPAANPSYEFDIFYLGVPMAQIMEVELLVMNDAFIDLTLCTGGANDVCNLCGNDALNGGEECDDGNNVDGDGCAADCTAEY